jgi:hypothetical protein
MHMKFTYSSGQRPLDGYTLKRGIGKGGFGEVYFSVSDGGKEVALKLLRGNRDVELRGVVQCLNLKHPNLVDLYDLRTDKAGDAWVVMEYVSGEPLNVVLSRHPQGLPPELAQQWFLSLARAVAYLHDHGIVHRDLKPGNVFLECGTVKVGDYGLCKFMSGSQNNRQSQSVGTVHYMAPEISTGNYNKQIDVYAAGVILYEMLTGQVPFDGDSAGEILMKHLTTPPDLSRVPVGWVPIIAKALAKNPALRYGSMNEMIRAVEGVGIEPPKRIPTVEPAPPRKQQQPAPQRPAEPVLDVLPAALTFRGRMAELCGSLALVPVFAAIAATLWATPGGMKDLTEIGGFFFTTVLACWAVLIPAKFWPSRRADSWSRRITLMILGASVGTAAMWLDGWWPRLPTSPAGSLLGLPPHFTGLFPSGGYGDLAAYVSYFALAFFALRWWKMAERQRSQRFSFAPILTAGFWSLILLLVWPQPGRGAVALVVASAIIQLVSPWDPPPAPANKRVRLRYA